MSKIVMFFFESAEAAFFFGTFLYAMAFCGDLLVSRIAATHDDVDRRALRS